MKDNTTSTTYILNERINRWIVASLFLVILPHVTHIPVWVSAISLIIVAIQFIKPLRSAAFSKLLLIPTVMLGTLGIIFEYGTLIGKETGIALLILMLSLKLLEIKSLRDIMLMVLLSFFLIITNFFYIQSIPIAIYMLIILLMLITTLIEITHQKPTRSVKQNIKLASTLMMQAIPVMIILFLFFPRLIGPIWGMPGQGMSTNTGLSDSMSPGSVSYLAQSDKVAFRVTFDGKLPPRDKLYWRGPVFWHTDGRRWSSGLTAEQQKLALIQKAYSTDPDLFKGYGPLITQHITLEPHNKKWVFALDMASAFSNNAKPTPSLYWLSDKNITDRIQYTATSFVEYTMATLSAFQQGLALQLPDKISPRIIALADSWKQISNKPEDIASLALLYFRTEKFIYTLAPPALGKDPVDEFLFETRKGFCEHYASAFVTLMRVADVPARIVTGYQGGEYNEVGNYLVVRQQDAHAWAEIWVPEKGWVRYDPTSAVAPERIEYSLQNDSIETGRAARFLLGNDNFLVASWQHLKKSVDAVNNAWNQWVLGYQQDKQKEFFKQFGFDVDLYDLAYSVIVILIFSVSVLSLWVVYQANRISDPVMKQYNKLCKKLSANGITRMAHEGPADFQSRCISAFPDKQDQLQLIFNYYIQLRYQHSGQHTAILKQFSKLIRQLKL